MALTEQQASAIERLRANESLTGDLTDRPATAVLQWAEEQIQANVVYEDVVAAVRAANRTGTEEVDEALGAARKSLAAAQAARGAAPPAAATVPAPPPPPSQTAPSAAPPKPAVPPSPTPPPSGGHKKPSKRKSGARE
ncbi:MAG: hypothetical protein U0768_00870 [Anaerolineae bacterium]